MDNFKIINEAATPENLVVFIHGFTGTDDTWEMKDGKMPFIGKLLEDVAIRETYSMGLFKYASASSGGDKSGNLFKRAFDEVVRKTTNNQQVYNQPIHKIAGMLQSEINLYIEENNLSSINLTFVAHSMGGLVSKRFFIDNSNEKRYVFKAFHSIHVPHQGSELAIIADMYKSNQQKIDLKPNSEIIKSLNDEWLEISPKKLPYTYYYIGESDNTVLATSALGSERRKEQKDYEKITHNGGHSDFLNNSTNMVWRKLSIGLKKNQSLDSLEKVKNKLSDRDKLATNEINNLYEEVDAKFPECREFTCFRFQKELFFDKIYNYTNAISNDLSDNREVFDEEIDAVVDSILA
jgi:triacylglycerol esterase/lipase EstA (alpha/beta hydrolase family)